MAFRIRFGQIVLYLKDWVHIIQPSMIEGNINMVKTEILQAESIINATLPIILIRFKNYRSIEDFVQSIPFKISPESIDKLLDPLRYEDDTSHCFETWKGDTYISFDLKFIQNRLISLRFQLIFLTVAEADLLRFKHDTVIPLLNQYTDNNSWIRNPNKLEKYLHKSIGDIDYGITIEAVDEHPPAGISFWITQEL